MQFEARVRTCAVVFSQLVYMGRAIWLEGVGQLDDCILPTGIRNLLWLIFLRKNKNSLSFVGDNVQLGQ